MMKNLKPCPFCGSPDIDPEGVASFKPEYRNSNNTWPTAQPHMIENRPACNNCGATTDGDWNTRATTHKTWRLHLAERSALEVIRKSIFG